MGRSYFQFKQFTIQQDRCAMKVGTDGVLLGAWARIRDASTVLDIGTGTGLVALMLAQRNPQVRITGIDIDPKAVEQARENAENSPFEERISMLNVSLQEFVKDQVFDAIVCNPPFFNQGTPSPDYGRFLARQSDSLPLPLLIELSERMMSEKGLLHLILPVDRATEASALIMEHGLHVNRLCKVFPSPQHAAKRVLMTAGRKLSNLIEDQMQIETGKSRFDYTQEYVELTKDFYLNM